MQSLWLYLHFPNLQLDSLCDLGALAPTTDDLAKDNDAHQGAKPIVILHAKSNTVIQLNQLALAAGIQKGMGLGTAAALDQHLQVVAYRADVEQKKLTEIAEHLYLVTSDICLFPPDGLLLRIHNMLTLYGGLAAYWRVLKGQLSHFRVSYHYATGQSPYAARMLARTQWDQISDHLPMLQHQIGVRQLSDSELSAKTVSKLNRVGIHTIADLMAISLKDIAKRFDIELVTYLGRLSGEFHHPIAFFHPQSRFQHYLELLYEISYTDSLLPPMKHQLQALEQFLKVRDRLTQKIIFTLHQRDADSLTLEVGSAQDEYQAAKWLQLIELKLAQLKLQAPVFALTLTTGSTQERCPDKADLFSARKGALSYLQLISILQARLGEQAVKQVCLTDDFRPDKVNHYQLPQSQHQPIDFRLQALRPSFLLNTAQPLTEKVTVIHGPERISTGWWDNQAMTRDYFIAQNSQQQWLWIFRTPNKKWFVHGLFS
ncbi:DNA polymerase Y family protein [Aliiglaciecola litoralis]|uniref:DNA polymerase Y family protein n=1 Tax=Aliiglaciecola litoralis TaxID=582857 RepID=A0ABP3WVX9_9ALTE